MKKLLLLFLAVSASAQPVTPSRGTNLLNSSAIFANQIFVDGVSGNDTGVGTIDAPYASINYAFQNAGPNTTINVLRGVFVDQQVKINAGTCKSFYFQSGVVIYESGTGPIPFYIDGITNDTVIFDGRGSLQAGFVMLGSYNSNSNLTVIINAANILPQSRVFFNTSAGLFYGTTEFYNNYYITADVITSTVSFSSGANCSQYCYMNITANQVYSSTSPATTYYGAFPIRNTVEITAPSITISGVANASFNNYIRYIWHNGYVSIPAVTTQTNCYINLDKIKWKSVPPSGAATNIVNGTTNAWY